MTRELGPLEPMLKRFPKVHRLNNKRSGCLWKKAREQNKKQTKKTNNKKAKEEASSKTS